MDMSWIETGMLNRNKKACARLITLVENQDESAIRLLNKLYPMSGNAAIIGITGAPGTGKSTLVNQLIAHLRKENYRVGVIAVDPSSPFSGGAILGDRIRMNTHGLDPDVFIRSLSTRGTLGGLSAATRDVALLLDIFGMDYILIETVGVGQSEIDIVRNCDTTVMVTAPGFGDDVQLIKAGIMEIGDIFVINKSDLEGAYRTASDVEKMLELSEKINEIPVLMTIACEDKGIDEVINAIKLKHSNLISSGELSEHRMINAKYELIDRVKNHIEKIFLDQEENEIILNKYAVDVASRALNPNKAMEELFSRVTGGNRENFKY